MTAAHRYEIKFVVNEVKLAEFTRWLWTRTGMREAYPDRVINSLYFDDVNFQSVKDNLAGMSNREKYRMRWYSSGNNEEARGVKLEKKIREGRLGRKLSAPLPQLEHELLKHEIGYLKAASIPQFTELGLFAGGAAAEIFPTLHVNYTRSYFEDMDDIRITIDNDIRFYQVSDSSCLFASRPLHWSKKIIEFKFAPDRKDRVAAMLAPLHLVPQRCSKYLQGLAYNGVVSYL